MTDSSPQAEYLRRRAESQETERRLDNWSAAFGHGRVVLVFIAIVLVLAAFGRGTPLPRTWLLVLAALVVITWVAQGVVDLRQRLARLRIALYDRGLARLGGSWRSFPSKGERFAEPSHPYATDLDVLGDGSLFQLLDTTRTRQGENTLARWLLQAGERQELLARQTAVQALALDLNGREALSLAGADEELSRIDEDPMIAWAEGPLLFNQPVPLIWAARILPFVTVGTYWLFHEALLPWWPLAVLVAVHAAILRRVRKQVAALGQIAEHSERMLSRLVPLIEATRQVTTDAPLLKALADRLAGAGESITSLKRRVTFFQSRGNMIVAVLSPLVFWDVLAAVMLEQWQRQTGRKLRDWLEAVGELEALSAAATYSFEHPQDSWPELASSEVTFCASGLGHPLLPAEHCVRNDLVLRGAGTGLLITGSNMSGKSTMLRAVGLNTVMALAGLPVRATSLTLSLVQVATVMRVSDSLQEGASFFLAEVKRLKQVVDLASGPRPLLFLLDEILQGTNTRERSLGARGVVAHLLEQGAFGLVSTHDLSLVQLGDAFGARLQYAHFTDQVEGDAMTFDYRLKPGVVQTSNALRLMRAVGLNVDVPEGHPPEDDSSSVKERA